MKTDTVQQGPKFSKLALTSVSLGVLGILILILRIPVYDPWWSEFVARNIVGLSGTVGLILGIVALARIHKLIAVITSLIVVCSFFLFRFSGGKHGLLFLRQFSSFLSLGCLVGLLIAAAALHWMSRSRKRLKGAALAIFGIVLATFLSAFWWAETCGPVSTAVTMKCGWNLKQLGEAMRAYATKHQGRYPQPDQWCDLLLKDTRVSAKRFFCPAVRFRWRRQVFPWPIPKKGGSCYALNPYCQPDSPVDTVLLFDTRPGWSQFGGPELLTFENHGGTGCNILFNDGDVEFVQAERINQLKWKTGKKETSAGPADRRGNYRRPATDEELEYWLQNMVWYHHFTHEEIRAATGLEEDEIATALNRFDIRLDNRPDRPKDAPLLVLPYPGGRHPRIGFLEGAIDPQRETKFSVFTPWDPNSYVVVDLPEAIWSNLGLTYLAHTHIDTIWTKQGIFLPKLEWNRRPDGTLNIERELPNGIVFGAKVQPGRVAVRMEMWLKNGTNQRLTDLRVQICALPKMAKGFSQQTNENKVLAEPYAACRSVDGKRWIITAWENCHRVWANERCPCFHSDPKFPDLQPGQSAKLHGRLSFYEGTDIETELGRIKQSDR